MSVEFSELLFKGVKKIVFAAISKRVIVEAESYLTQRKIKGRIDDSIAQVVEQLMPFFENEHLSDNKRQVLISNCIHELSEILEEPKEVFAASLDGQKMFDRRYENGQLPQGIRDEGLEDLYALVFPQIANLICAYPPAIEQWKIAGYQDGFRRLDEIATMLGGVAHKLDQLSSQDSQTADILLNRVRQSLAQRVEFQLDLTGLRGDRPDAVPLEKCFIVPELSRVIEEKGSIKRTEFRVGKTAQTLNAFSHSSVRAIVVGAAGAGKSTWSRWLQRQQLMNESARLPVLVRLRDLIKAPTLPSHQDLIREAAGTHLREEVDSSVSRKWCESGTVTFILDGFDEVPPNQRDAVLSWVQELDDATQKPAIILTTRPLTTNHLQKLPKKWLRWELLPFDQPRITDYISKWHAHAPLLTEKDRHVDANELSNKWVNDFALKPLVGTPLMLTTIVMVHHIDGRLPEGRARLYERYIKGMLGLWDSRWGIPSAIKLSDEQKLRILTRLAVHLHLENMEQLGDKEIEEWVQTILPDIGCFHPAREVLDNLRERSGLLIGPGTWSFVHKSVGEFLVGTAIRDGDYVDDNGQRLDRLRLFAERHNDRWNNVLFFWAGSTPPGDLRSFIEQILNESDPIDAVLALSLIYDQRQLDRLTEPWKSKQLLKLLRRSFWNPSCESLVFVCGPLPRAMKTRIEGSFPVLRMPEITGFRGALWECLRSSNIDWKTAARCHPSLLFITWSFFATEAPNAENLKTSLDKKTWPTDLRSNWLMFPATWGLRSAVSETGGLPIKDFVHVLGESDPKMKRGLPFFLLGALVGLITEKIQDAEMERINNLLLVLNDVTDYELDVEWLKLSVDVIEDTAQGEKHFDLLLRSEQILDRLLLQPALDTTAVSGVRTFVETLVKRRSEEVKRQFGEQKWHLEGN